MEKNGITLAKYKTETVVLKGPRNKDNIVIRAGETSLQPVKHLKYLRITLSENGGFRKHIRGAAKKIEERIATLSRIMPNISGPSSQKRSMLHGVVKSVLLYGAQLWHPVLEKVTYKNLLTKVVRKSLLRICSAYRTTSIKALNIVAGEIPLYLLANERHRLHLRDEVNQQAKKEERIRTLDAWQEEWERSDGVAEWTRTLIPELGKWLKCEHRCTDLTQVLTGHGAFRTYLKRFKRAETEKCIHCSTAPDGIPKGRRYI
ncbi:hypothetical protein JTB14_030581 [Gonioctena quinquepunctata]|nr:hypothetical protein JTB14_030581 [Gonioctena quinquepunctata]